MREVKSGSQFRKDLKRYKNDTARLEKLYDIVGYLERCEEIPKEFKPHMLTGDYAGHMECHVENDFLLILKSASNLNGNLNCSKELEHYAS